MGRVSIQYTIKAMTRFNNPNKMIPGAPYPKRNRDCSTKKAMMNTSIAAKRFTILNITT